MIKGILALAIVLVGIFGPTATVSAHVLVMDTTNSMGAILHIIPDDDPVAGEKAEIYFDKQGRQIDGSTVTLNIRNSDANDEQIDTKTEGTLTTASYIFPTQGAYEMKFTIKEADTTYVFEHTQRVSRGVFSEGAAQQHYIWAELLGVVSVVGLLTLAVVVLSRRKEIAKHSTF